MKTMDSLAVNHRFFASLIEANLPVLDRLLTEDFILIDVLSGSEITKPDFLAAIGSRQVTFDVVEPADNRERQWQETSIVTGCTRIQGRLREKPFATTSRYTHVFVNQQGEWRMMSAQGTPIAPSPKR